MVYSMAWRQPALSIHEATILEVKNAQRLLKVNMALIMVAPLRANQLLTMFPTLTWLNSGHIKPETADARNIMGRLPETAYSSAASAPAKAPAVMI